MLVSQSERGPAQHSDPLAHHLKLRSLLIKPPRGTLGETNLAVDHRKPGRARPVPFASPNPLSALSSSAPHPRSLAGRTVGSLALRPLAGLSRWGTWAGTGAWEETG